MKYNVLTFVTNASNQFIAAVNSTFDDLSLAKVRYHQTCANFENAKDVKVATVMIVNEYGNKVKGFYEIIDHRVAAEPEPQEEVTEP